MEYGKRVCKRSLVKSSGVTIACLRINSEGQGVLFSPVFLKTKLFIISLNVCGFEADNIDQPLLSILWLACVA